MQILTFPPLWLRSIHITPFTIAGRAALCNGFSLIGEKSICLHNIVFPCVDWFFFKLSCYTILSLKHRLREHWFLPSPWHVYIKSALKCRDQAFCYRRRALLSADWALCDESLLCPNDISCVHGDRRWETCSPKELSVSTGDITPTFTASELELEWNLFEHNFPCK